MEARRRQSQEIGPTRCVRAWGNRSPCFTCAFPPLHTPAPCMFEAAVTSQHTEGLGVATQFHFFFFWQMTPWQLEKMLGSLNRFLSYKNKMCWSRQRQTFCILLLNPNESTDKCHPTPTPSVPWLFFFPLQKCHKLKRWQIYMAQTDTGFFQVYIAYRLTQIEMV